VGFKIVVVFVEPPGVLAEPLVVARNTGRDRLCHFSALRSVVGLRVCVE
jgi:hypothetical protein